VLSKAKHEQARLAISPLPTPNPSQEGNKKVPSWEGLGVGIVYAS